MKNGYKLCSSKCNVHRYATGCKISLNEQPGEIVTKVGIFAPNKDALDAALKAVNKVGTPYKFAYPV